MGMQRTVVVSREVKNSRLRRPLGTRFATIWMAW